MKWISISLPTIAMCRGRGNYNISVIPGMKAASFSPDMNFTSLQFEVSVFIMHYAKTLSSIHPMVPEILWTQYRVDKQASESPRCIMKTSGVGTIPCCNGSMSPFLPIMHQPVGVTRDGSYTTLITKICRHCNAECQNP